MISKRGFCCGLGALLLTGCAPASGPVGLAPGSRLLLVRHGDRSGDESDLNAIGRARAEALVTALDGMELDAIYSPGIQRNLDTAAPLSRARGLPISRLPMERVAPKLMRVGSGRSVIWIGNKGNLADIWTALGAPGPAPLDYGDLAILTPGPEATPSVQRRRFGP